MNVTLIITACYPNWICIASIPMWICRLYFYMIANKTSLTLPYGCNNLTLLPLRAIPIAAALHRKQTLFEQGKKDSEVCEKKEYESWPQITIALCDDPAFEDMPLQLYS